MRRNILFAILLFVNALPLAFLGAKLYDLVGPKVSLRHLVLASQTQYAMQPDITRIKIEIEILASQVYEAKSAEERERHRQALERQKARLRELEEQKKAAEKRAEEERAEREKEQERQYQLQLAEQRHQQRQRDIELALAVVVAIFVLTVGVLWLLAKFGNPLQGEVRAEINHWGGRLWVTAVGIVGAFLAIVLVGVGAVYFLAQVLIVPR